MKRYLRLFKILLDGGYSPEAARVLIITAYALDADKTQRFKLATSEVLH